MNWLKSRQCDSIESAKHLSHRLDRSVPETRADQVWLELGAGHRGEGVLVGIIDSGIDYRHGDFRTEDDQSRILAIWDQLDNSGAAPDGYPYGTLWEKTSLDQKTCAHIPRRFHGTHVASIAAGDGSETGNGQPAYQYVGMAPDANLLIVNHEDDVRDTQILDAVNWLFQRAGNRPIAVNMSFGAHYGLHDGSYTLDQALNQLAGSGIPGRVICAAVGNEGDDTVHAKSILSAPANNFYPYFRIYSTDDYEIAIIQSWYPAALSVQARMWIPKDDQMSEYVTTNWVSKNGRHVLAIEEGSLQGAIVTVDARQAPYPQNPNYNLITFIIEKNGQEVDLSKFEFDVEFNGEGVPLESWIAFSPPGVQFAGNPNDQLRIQPDSEVTINTPASAENVIGVASYVTKNSWVTVDGNVHEDSSAVIGDIAVTSGRGPLQNGVRKPDIAAPGQYIYAAWESNIQPDYGTRRSHSTPDGKHFVDQGTSMASPHVCGAAALLLQKNPALDAAQIKSILTQTAIDAGAPGWDGRWGAGKMNVKAAWDAVPAIQPSPSPTIPPAKPTPTLPSAPNDVLAPLIVYEFNRSSLADCGWGEIIGAFVQAPPGKVETNVSMINLIPSTQDQQGISITIQEKQVQLLFAKNPVQTGGSPILIRAVLRAEDSPAMITLAALKGNLTTYQGVDSSIATNMAAGAKDFVEQERCLILMYEPDQGEIITPMLQVAATNPASALRVWIDRIEIYQITKNLYYPGRLFYSTWTDQTSSPQNTPHPTAPIPPTSTKPVVFSPTPTWTPVNTPTWTQAPVYTPTQPPPTLVPTPAPSDGWTVVMNDAREGLSGAYDLKQLLAQITGRNVTFRLVFHDSIPDEAIRKTQVSIEIYLDTDRNRGPAIKMEWISIYPLVRNSSQRNMKRLFINGVIHMALIGWIFTKPVRSKM